MKQEIRMPAGEYILGDPCYAIRDEHWRELLDESDHFEKPFVVLKGHPVLAFGTLYGDGVYPSNVGMSFGVDAGLIGLVSANLVAADFENRDTMRVKFDEEFLCTRTEDGELFFGHISIFTGDIEDEEEDDEFFDDEEEDEGTDA